MSAPDRASPPPYPSSRERNRRLSLNQRWDVSGGFFEVSNNSATVLADGVGVETAKT